MANAPAIHAEVEHSIRKFLEAAAADPTPLESLPPAKARKVLEDVQKGADVTLPNANVSEKIIKADGQDISLTIVRPMGATKTLPAFMFFHGGGWVLGDYPTHEGLIRDLVDGSGCVAI
jgi:acetyl esterase/lipase